MPKERKPCFLCGRYCYTERHQKDIPGYEGLYAITDRGEVLSLSFRNNKTIKTRQEPIVMKPRVNHGYLTITLQKCGKQKSYYIHRLVAEAFVENPNGYKVVNHKDEDRANNLPENLEWCTQQYNVNYSREKMRKPKSKSKKTNTGYKYISLKKHRDKYVYRLYIRQRGICKHFETLEEALRYREGVI